MKLGKLEISKGAIAILAIVALLILSEVETHKTNRLKLQLKIKELEVRQLELQTQNKLEDI